MNRIGLGLLTAFSVLVFSSQLFAGMGDEEWKTFSKEILAKLNSKEPAMRKLAANKLGECDRKDACELLLKLMEYTRKVQAPLQAEIDELAEKIEKIGSGPTPMNPSGPSVTKGELTKPHALKMRDLEHKNEAEQEVYDACVEALAKTTNTEALEWLRDGGFKSSVPSDRAAVAEVMGIVKWPGAGSALISAYDKEKDAMAKLAICEALGRIGGKDATPTLAKAISDPAWQVRLAALGAIRKIGGKEAVDAILPAFEKENLLRLRNEFADALKMITGMDYGKDTTTWKKWWADNGASFTGPVGTANKGSGSNQPGATAAFFGIPVDSDKVVFILDISGSMNELSDNTPPPATISSGPGQDDGKDRDLISGPKIDVAKHELKKCLKKLDKKVTFNIYFFNDAWSKWQEKMVPADANWKNEAYTFIDKQSANNQTNLWDPLEDALKSAGMGISDKHYASALDTIFILSDGAPYPPDVYVNSEEILRRVKEMNPLKKVKIHCIGIGKSANEFLLKGISQATGGTYIMR